MARGVVVASLASVLWHGGPTSTMALETRRGNGLTVNETQAQRVSYACYDYADSVVPIIRVQVESDRHHDLATTVAVLFGARVREQLVFEVMTACMRAAGYSDPGQPVEDGSAGP